MSTASELNRRGLGALFGWARNVDARKAFEEFGQAAAGGSVAAQNNMGVCLAFGFGAPRDVQRALKTLSAAADAGDLSSCYNLGLYLYISSWTGGVKGSGAGLRLLERAAATLVRAQAILRLAYSIGLGVPRSRVEEKRWGNAVSLSLARLRPSARAASGSDFDRTPRVKGQPLYVHESADSDKGSAGRLAGNNPGAFGFWEHKGAVLRPCLELRAVVLAKLLTQSPRVGASRGLFGSLFSSAKTQSRAADLSAQPCVLVLFNAWLILAVPDTTRKKSRVKPHASKKRHTGEILKVVDVWSTPEVVSHAVGKTHGAPPYSIAIEKCVGSAVTRRRGFLLKQGQPSLFDRHPEWRRRWFWLDERALKLWYCIPGYCEARGFICINGARVRKTNSADTNRFKRLRGWEAVCFAIESSASNGSAAMTTYLRAATESDARAWIQALTRAAETKGSSISRDSKRTACLPRAPFLVSFQSVALRSQFITALQRVSARRRAYDANLSKFCTPPVGSGQTPAHEVASTVSPLPGTDTARDRRNARKRQQKLTRLVEDSKNVQGVGQLLAASANANSKDSHGRWLLQVSVERESLPIVRELLNARADANVSCPTTGKAMTPLHIAVRDLMRRSVNLWSVQSSSDDAVQNLIQITKALVAARANPRAVDVNGDTPLTLFVRAAVRQSPSSARNRVATTVIAALGDSVTSAGGNGQRPLDIAVAVSDLSMTRLLVLHGADPLVPHAKGDLSIAFTMASKHDPKILQSALQAAFERASVSADGEPSSPTASLVCADAAKRLSSFREFAVERDSKGDTAMHCAAERRFLAAPVLAILLRAGADATAKSNRDGQTALHRVAARGPDGAVAAAEVLLAHGARPNARDADGNTALHFSTDAAVSTRLVELGVRPEIRNKSKQTAMLGIGILPFKGARARRATTRHVSNAADRKADIARARKVRSRTALSQAAPVAGRAMALAQVVEKNNWARDADCPICALCEVKFGVITRRHHCRLCGEVVCSKCSTKRIACGTSATKSRGTTSARACDVCFNQKLLAHKVRCD